MSPGKCFLARDVHLDRAVDLLLVGMLLDGLHEGIHALAAAALRSAVDLGPCGAFCAVGTGTCGANGTPFPP